MLKTMLLAAVAVVPFPMLRPRSDIPRQQQRPLPVLLMAEPEPDSDSRPGPATATPPLLRTRATRQRRLVAPHEAVNGFLSWMRDNDFSGWHTAADIEEFYRWYCEEEGVEEMPEAAMRERFAALPGVDKVRRRIQHSTEKQLVRIRRRIEADTSQVHEKPVLYRVASHEEAAEALAKNRPNRSAKPIRKAA